MPRTRTQFSASTFGGLQLAVTPAQGDVTPDLYRYSHTYTYIQIDIHTDSNNNKKRNFKKWPLRGA